MASTTTATEPTSLVGRRARARASRSRKTPRLPLIPPIGSEPPKQRGGHVGITRELLRGGRRQIRKRYAQSREGVVARYVGRRSRQRDEDRSSVALVVLTRAILEVVIEFRASTRKRCSRVPATLQWLDRVGELWGGHSAGECVLVAPRHLRKRSSQGRRFEESRDEDLAITCAENQRLVLLDSPLGRLVDGAYDEVRDGSPLKFRGSLNELLLLPSRSELKPCGLHASTLRIDLYGSKPYKSSAGRRPPREWSAPAKPRAPI